MRQFVFGRIAASLCGLSPSTLVDAAIVRFGPDHGEHGTVRSVHLSIWNLSRGWVIERHRGLWRLAPLGELYQEDWLLVHWRKGHFVHPEARKAAAEVLEAIG